MQETLNQYGYGFQVKVLTSLLTDREFLAQSVDLLEPNYFESPSLKWLIERTFDYFKEYKIAPSLDVFKIQISNIPEQQTLRSEVIHSIKEIFQEVGSSDLEYIKKTAIKFGQRQAVKMAFENSLSDFEKGDYDAIVSKITKAAQQGQQVNDFGHNFIEDVVYRYTDQAEPERVKTGFETLDDVTSGGLPKGCLGIAIAPSGIGKCVGPKTDIEIEYEEIGIELKHDDGSIKGILWVKPWDHFIINNFVIFGYQIPEIMNEMQGLVSECKK